MSKLDQKRIALKALKELKRTNPDQYAASRQKKTEAQSQQKRYLVQAKQFDIWQTLDSTDHQGEAVQFVIECRWSKLYPEISWKVIDTEWLTSKRGKSVVMWVVSNKKSPPDAKPIVLPVVPIFPLESFVRVAELQETIDED